MSLLQRVKRDCGKMKSHVAAVFFVDRKMLVKFPLSRSFGICKAAALLHPARTSEQKFFSVLGLRVQKEQIFCKKRQKRS